MTLTPLSLLLLLAPPAHGWELCESARAEGWRQRDGALLAPLEVQPPSNIDFASLEAFAQTLDALQAQGSQVVAMLVPPRALAFSDGRSQPDVALDFHRVAAEYQGARRWLIDQGVATPDLLSLSLEMADQEPGFFRVTGPHWTQDGAWAATRTVAEAVDGLSLPGVVGSAPHSTTLVGWDEDLSGGWARALEETCPGDKATERVRLYRTRTAPEASVGLFDELPPAPVVLLAASFGEPHFNLEGFLADELDARVLPVAIAGGGVLSPAREYLQSEAYAQAPAPLIVWVIDHPALFGRGYQRSPAFRTPAAWRQLTATSYGTCAEPRPTASTQVSAKPGVVPLFVGLRGLPSSETYLELDAPGLQQVSFTVRIGYASGRIEDVLLRPDRRTTPSPQQFLGFDTTVPGDVRSVRLVLPADVPAGPIDARLCAVPKP